MDSFADRLFQYLVGVAVTLLVVIPLVVWAIWAGRQRKFKNELED